MHRGLPVLRRRRDHGSVTMRVAEVGVFPVLRFRRQQADIVFPGGEIHLLQAAVDHVAVDIHVGEMVVGADTLQLLIDVIQEFRIPHWNVVQVRPQFRVQDILVRHAGRYVDVSDVVEVKRGQGGVDVVLHELTLGLDRVRLDDEAVDGGRNSIDGAHSDGGHEQQSKHRDRGFALAPVDQQQCRHGNADQADDGDPDQRQVVIDLQKARPEELRFMSLRVQQLVAFEKEAPGKNQRGHQRQAGEVHARPGRPVLQLAGRNAMLEEIQDRDRDRQHPKSQQQLTFDELVDGQ